MAGVPVWEEKVAQRQKWALIREMEVFIGSLGVEISPKLIGIIKDSIKDSPTEELLSIAKQNGQRAWQRNPAFYLAVIDEVKSRS